MNKDIAPYNNVLNNAAGIYFSVNANMAIAVKLAATKIKYIFFCLFIISLGIICPICSPLFITDAPGKL
jgi:hypothetical protein